MRRQSRAVGVVALVLVLVLAVVVAPSVPALASSGTQDRVNPCVGTITEQPDAATLLSVQGARGGSKTAALLLGIQPDGEFLGVHNDSANGRWWVYDVDRLANGNLLMSTTEPAITIVEEVDPETGEHVSERRFPDVLDAHDVDLINGNELLVNDMSYDGDDRVFVYNLTTESVVWEYRFADHPDQFPHEQGGEFGEDWTHNNDVEKIGDGVYMVSVRNFDQVVAIERDSKEVRWTLGEYGNHSILNEQHNPDHIEGPNGTSTVVVADSRNDRVVEYAMEDGEWNRTWVLRGGGLNEPRDADRLPNGNTLVVDRRGHRLVEVTPRGEVVWELYAPWQPYDAERLGTGDESTQPTMRQHGTTGIHTMTGSAGVNEARTEACYEYLASWDGSTRLVPADAPPPNAVATPDGGAGTGGTDDGALGTPPSRLPGGPMLVAGLMALVAVLGLAGLALRRMG